VDGHTISLIVMRASFRAVCCGSLLALLGVLGPTAAFAQSQQPVQTSARASLGSVSSTVGDPTALLGLPEPAQGQRVVISLAELLAAVDAAPDVRVAVEQVHQADASVRRAWAGVLPNLQAVGSYTHNCLAGGEDVISCGDRTSNFNTSEQSAQQATLFDGLAEVIGLAADFASSADEEQRLRQQQTELRDAAAAARTTTPKSIVVQPASVWAGAATLTVPLLNPRAYPLIANANTSVRLADHAKEQVRSVLRLQATRGYLALATADKLVVAGERQLGALRLHRDATAARVEAATTPMLALRRAELDVLRAEQNLDQLQGAAEAARASLGLLLGKTEAFAVELPEVMPGAVVAGTEQELVEQALQARPDVAVARAQQTLAEGAVWDAWTQFMPSVGAVASARVTSFTQGFVSDPITATLSVQATLPLYDGGLRYAALHDANSRVTEQEIRLRQTTERVGAQVRGNLREVRMRERSWLLAKQALVVAIEADEQAKAAFDAGVGTAVDASDATVIRANAENDALRAELDVVAARAGLSFVVGQPLN
jgi:outer membrane protein